MKKKNNLLDNIKLTFIDFKDWYNNSINYKKTMQETKDLEDENYELKKTIEAKDRKIEELKITIETKDNLLEKLELRVIELKEEISNLKKEGK